MFNVLARTEARMLHPELPKSCYICPTGFKKRLRLYLLPGPDLCGLCASYSASESESRFDRWEE